MSEDIIKDTPSFPELARFNFEKIVEIKRDVEKNFLDLAFLFVQSRDFRLWEFLSFESFEAFIGDPSIGMKRSTVYGLMQVYDLYVSKLNIAEDELVVAGHTKLLTIAPIVEKNPTDVHDWVNKAKELSKSDLKTETSAAMGKGDNINFSPPKSPPPSPGPLDSVCCVCGKGPVDKHHFPVARGTGNKCPTDWTIPLCREEHGKYHQDPKEWIWENRRFWAAYLFSKIAKAEKQYGELVETVSTRTDQNK